MAGVAPPTGSRRHESKQPERRHHGNGERVRTAQPEGYPPRSADEVADARDEVIVRGAAIAPLCPIGSGAAGSFH